MIEGAIGLPGQGKTYYGAWRGLRAMKRGRPVGCNFSLKGADFVSKQDLIDKNLKAGGLYIWDEAHLDFNARNWREFGDDMTRFFSQTRKLEITLLWICQDIKTMDRIIRDRTHLIHDCKSIGSWGDHPWAFSVKSYYGANNVGKEKFLAGNTFYRFRKEVGDSYDTHEILLGDKGITNGRS